MTLVAKFEILAYLFQKVQSAAIPVLLTSIKWA